jgi:hypothetical protein
MPNETAVGAFHSTNGGASWSAVTTIATIRHHTVAGGLREGPLSSADVDNHFIPGLAVNKTTSGSAVQLGVTYYLYPSRSTLLSVGFHLIDEPWQQLELGAADHQDRHLHELARDYQPGAHGRRLHLDVFRRERARPRRLRHRTLLAAPRAAACSTTALSRRIPSRPAARPAAARLRLATRSCSAATVTPQRAPCGTWSTITAARIAIERLRCEPPRTRVSGGRTGTSGGGAECGEAEAPHIYHRARHRIDPQQSARHAAAVLGIVTC